MLDTTIIKRIARKDMLLAIKRAIETFTEDARQQVGEYPDEVNCAYLAQVYQYAADLGSFTDDLIRAYDKE